MLGMTLGSRTQSQGVGVLALDGKGAKTLALVPVCGDCPMPWCLQWPRLGCHPPACPSIHLPPGTLPALGPNLHMAQTPPPTGRLVVCVLECPS